ncbi:MAG: heavy metal translocating P-type ATPase, partial [Clostridia bacterium]|nr:heavy metal translocating P-type ATPase [Clostridia bacterium]
MKRVHYEIEGMTCAACVAHVERALKKVLEPNDVFTVSLLTNSISVIRFNEIKNEEELLQLEKKLKDAVAAAGYRMICEDQKKKTKKESSAADLVRLLISAAFTLCLMYLSMGGMLNLPIPPFLEKSPFKMALAQLILTLPVVILNFRFFKKGFSALFHLSPNMDSLIAVGAGASLIYGIVAICMIGYSLSNGGNAEHWLHDLYFESAASILTLVSFGKLLEARAKKRASDAITSLASLSPKLATVLRNGEKQAIPTEEIQIGEMILIRAGELIPVDGEVMEGSGTVDESALTGESMPIEKEVGSEVRAACILTDGAVTVRATRIFEDSSLSRIIRLLEDAASTKAPIARIADSVSAIFVPAVMGISLLTLAVWLLITQNAEQAFRSAISVLVISCPCALGLATPTAITVGIGRGAKMGILFRNAESLEKLCSVESVLFDKTGTLTEGKPSLTDVYSYGMKPEQLLRFAASVENYSSHPLAHAVVEGAEKLNLSLLHADRFENRIGFGASASIEERV